MKECFTLGNYNHKQNGFSNIIINKGKLKKEKFRLIEYNHFYMNLKNRKVCF
jgi:hypothetical protein